MSVQEMGGAAIPEVAATTNKPERIITSSSILGAVSITVFVSTQVTAVAMIVAWAVSGALGAGPRTAFVFYGLALVCAVIATTLTWGLAWNAETSPDNNI